MSTGFCAVVILKTGQDLSRAAEIRSETNVVSSGGAWLAPTAILVVCDDIRLGEILLPQAFLHSGFA